MPFLLHSNDEGKWLFFFFFGQEGEQADKRVWRHADVDRPKLEHMESFHLEKQALAVPSCCAK